MQTQDARGEQVEGDNLETEKATPEIPSCEPLSLLHPQELVCPKHDFPLQMK
jgi:hypothetical protein